MHELYSFLLPPTPPSPCSGGSCTTPSSSWPMPPGILKHPSPFLLKIFDALILLFLPLKWTGWNVRRICGHLELLHFTKIISKREGKTAC